MTDKEYEDKIVMVNYGVFFCAGFLLAYFIFS